MGKKSNPDLISVEMLKDRIDDTGTIIIDVRTASDYAKGHWSSISSWIMYSLP
ncbi:MAG: rhodanese-like domain-containing protein [ANME-2 cluster archaeon]|nr:rhodanese-like domain-containing protein [ANME-2 cluster archaeon]